MTATWGGSLASPARPQFVPSARLSVGWVSAWLQERRTQVASATLLGAIVDLRLFARAAYPNLDWRWMARLEAAVRQRGGGARDKRQLFRNVAELVELGETLMRRSGLMITLLALRPLRLQNFTALTLHQSLRCQGDGWWIVLPEEATKNRRPLELPFPDRLVPALEHYLARVRPLLLEGRIERGQRCRLDLAPRDGDEPSERLRADHHANRPGLRPPGQPPPVSRLCGDQHGARRPGAGPGRGFASRPRELCHHRAALQPGQGGGRSTGVPRGCPGAAGRRREATAMRVAVYARYSSDQQREASIEDQVRLCRELAAQQG